MHKKLCPVQILRLTCFRLIFWISRDRKVFCFDHETTTQLWKMENCHNSDIHDVDFHQNVVVTGSRDATVKVSFHPEFTDEASFCETVWNFDDWPSKAKRLFRTKWLVAFEKPNANDAFHAMKGTEPQLRPRLCPFFAFIEDCFVRFGRSISARMEVGRGSCITLSSRRTEFGRWLSTQRDSKSHPHVFSRFWMFERAQTHTHKQKQKLECMAALCYALLHRQQTSRNANNSKKNWGEKKFWVTDGQPDGHTSQPENTSRFCSGKARLKAEFFGRAAESGVALWCCIIVVVVIFHGSDPGGKHANRAAFHMSFAILFVTGDNLVHFSSFVTGTTGIDFIPPLRMWDMNGWVRVWFQWLCFLDFQQSATSVLVLSNRNCVTCEVQRMGPTAKNVAFSYVTARWHNKSMRENNLAIVASKWVLLAFLFLSTAPMNIFCASCRALLANLGGPYRNGAGVLDIQFESPNVLFSCGYDTLVRMWDLRTSHNKWWVSVLLLSVDFPWKKSRKKTPLFGAKGEQILVVRWTCRDKFDSLAGLSLSKRFQLLLSFLQC